MDHPDIEDTSRGGYKAAARAAVLGLFAALAGVVLVGTAAPVAYAHADEPREGFVVSRWGVGDGLPQSSVTSILQSRDGYLWVTTFGGIARFDGVRFVVYDVANTPALRGNRFVSAIEDHSGALWFGGQNAELLRYRDGAFERVELPPVVHGSARGMDEDEDGTLWVATSQGLVAVRDGRAERLPMPDSVPIDIADVLVAGDGTLWVNNEVGPSCVRGPGCARPGVPLAVEHVFVLGDVAYRAPDGTRWFLMGSGAWSLAASAGDDAMALTRELVPEPAVSPDEILRAIAIDPRRERVWLGLGHHLYLRDGRGAAWKAMNETLGVAVGDSHEGIRSLLVDREGAVWIGTDRGGLTRVQDADTTRYAADAGLPFPTFSVLEDRDGRQWVSGSCVGPLVRARGGAFAAAPGAPLRCGEAMALAPDGAVWVTDIDKLVRYAGDDVRTFPVRTAHEGRRSHALAFDDRGALWLGTEDDGLSRLVADGDGYRIERRWGEADGLGEPVLTVVPVPAAEGGGVWLGTTLGAVRMSADFHQIRYDESQGLARGAIRDIHLGAGGTVWLGSYGGGLTRFRDGVFKTFTSKDGLCDDTVSRIIEDHGELWMNGNRGVCHVPLDDLEAVAAGTQREVRCTLLRSGEGNGGNQPAGWRGGDGRLWFPTVDGVVAVDPKAHLRAAVAPVAAIEDAQADGASLDVRGREPAVEVEPGPGDLVIHYTGIAFDAPTTLRFRHRLVGLSDTWVEAGFGRVASYTHLPPGDYVFELKVQSPRGEWSEPARLAVTLLPHLYERAWFQVALAMLVIAGAFALFQARMRSVAQRAEVLQVEVVERQHAEARAKEQEHHYRMLFEQTTDGLFVHAADGRLVEVNGAAAMLVGLERAALLGNGEGGLASRLGAEAREAWHKLVVAAATGHIADPIDVTIERPDGSRVELRAQAVGFDVRGVPHALCTAADITAVRKAEARRHDYEQRLQQVQRLESLGLLAAGIAHDFNNRLGSIGASTTLIRERTTEPEIRGYANDITKSVELASALVRKLLAFGPQQRGNVATLDPAAAVSRLVPFLTQRLPTAPGAPELRVVHVDEGPPVEVKIDPLLLEQCVMNLVTNARDAMRDGGTITLTTHVRQVSPDQARQHRVDPGRFAVIAVRDTGHGIDAETRGKIFDPFFTTRPLGQGLGLGLTVTHAAVEQAKGFITVESAVGAGATFRLHLPVVEAAPEAAAGPIVIATPEPPAGTRARPTPLGSPLPKTTILLCDDDDLLRRAAKRMLELRGFKIVDASSPDSALDLFAADPAAFDLLLSDVVMPAFSGPELARRARAIRPTLPVVLMSGHTRDVMIETMNDGAELPFVQKPFTVDVLASAIRAALGPSETTGLG